MNRTLAGLILFTVLVCSLSCMRNRQSLFRKSRIMMDTYVTITVVSDSEKTAEAAIERAFSAVERFGRLIDFFSDRSELAEINRSAGLREVRVSPETMGVIEKALLVSEKSEGAFDPTIGPVMKLWDFHNKVKPSDQATREALPLVQYKSVTVNREHSTVFLRRRGMLMDLGGIAKGYAADLAVSELKKTGIHAGIVSAAGDIRTFGLKPDGRPWTVGIRNSRQKDEKDEIMAKVKLTDRAISTSGDYERFFIENGQRFHHLIDPRTGHPGSLCRSVSIIADEGVVADAFSTAVFLLGPERGLDLIEKNNLEGVIVDAAGTVHTTAGLKEILTLETGN